MTSNEFLDKISIRAFELDLYYEDIDLITKQLNEEFAEELKEYGTGMNGAPAKFNSDMVHTMIEFENIRYMMDTAKIREDKLSMSMQQVFNAIEGNINE